MSDPESHITFQAPEIATLAPLFPGYEFETLIATGGMGAVYRAVQKSLDRTVAIKILPDEFSKDASFCAGFEAEAKAMARLNHPNLVGVYDFGEINGMLYIIMEYVPGQSLFHSADGIAIAPDEVIRLFTGICNGLAHAHEHGILHRDIKPSNILLDLNAQPKISDFGLARPVEHTVQPGEEIFGTPHYTAPEVVNSPHTVDHRADIFSVGVMLHELLTGTLPANDPRPASAIIHCDPRFDAVIRRATNPQPEARYSSAAEIANELHVISSTAGPRVLQTNVPRKPAPSLARPRIHPQNQSSGTLGIIIALIAIAIIALAFSIFSRKPPEQDDNAPQPPAQIPTVPDQAQPIPPSPPKPEPAIGNAPETIAPRETAADPDPEIAPIPPALPAFDVRGFFERARTVMKKRAAPIIDKRDRTLATNWSNFGIDLQRIVRNIGPIKERSMAIERLDSFLANDKAYGNRIPTELDGGLAEIPGVEAIHQKYLQRQDVIDTSLSQELSRLASLYILGLENQIERLKSENDPAAITLIEAEIQKTRSDHQHFPRLVLGSESPDPETDEPQHGAP